MNILLVTSGLSSVGQGGGISSYVHDLAENLLGHGHQVVVYLVAEHSMNKPLCSVPYVFEFFQLPHDREKEIQVVKQLYESILRLSPDIVINNDVAALAGLWPVLPEQMVRISVMHGFHPQLVWNNSGIQGKIAVHNIQYIDYVVCQNMGMMHAAIEKYALPQSQLCCIYQTTTAPMRSIEKTDSVLRIVFAGGDSERKGAKVMERLCNALSKTNWNFEVHWCLSAISYKERFSHDCRFVFHGSLPRERFYEILTTSDIMIVPTLLDTGPLLVVEAMAMGVVPLCHRLSLSSIPDLVEEGLNGYTVEHNDVSEYISIIRKLLENRSLCYLIGQNAQEYFFKHLSPEIQYEKFTNIFVKNPEVRCPARKEWSLDNVLYNHNHRTTHYSKFSIKRVLAKFLTHWELPLTHQRYKILKKIGL